MELNEIAERVHFPFGFCENNQFENAILLHINLKQQILFHLLQKKCEKIANVYGMIVNVVWPLQKKKTNQGLS